MTTLPALAVKHPKFGDAFLGGQRHAQQTEMNALGMETRKLQNQGIQRDHAIQSLRLVGGMALGAKNGDPNGEVDPEKYAQMRELLKNKFGMEISEDPSSADSLFRSSLTAMQQVGMAKDERAVSESLRRWDIANQRANRAEGRAGEMHRLKVEQMQNPKVEPTKEMKNWQFGKENPGFNDSQNSNFKDEHQLRKEFEAVTKDYRGVRDAYGRVQASAKQPSAAGDLALIFNYMKILDPGSVVRESEFATAAASGSYGERLKAAGQRIQSGERLSDEMRADFVARAKSLYDERQTQYGKTENQFRTVAKRYKMNADNIVLDYNLWSKEDEYKAELKKRGLE